LLGVGAALAVLIAVVVALGAVRDNAAGGDQVLKTGTTSFRIESYTEDSAIIQFARKARETADGQPTWEGMRTAAVWRDGDWKLTTVSGEQQVQMKSLRNIEGWTQW
jgi:hypothetical protein